jgi:hypothetical protein
MSGKNVNQTIRLGRLLECQYCNHMIGTTENCPACETHRQLSASMLAHHTDGVSKTAISKMVIDELNSLQEGDWEGTHGLAEKYLLNFLVLTGNKDIVDAFEEAKYRCDFKYS